MSTDYKMNDNREKKAERERERKKHINGKTNNVYNMVLQWDITR